MEIAFSPEAAAIVTETTWHQTQKVHRNRDGSVVLSFRVDGLNEIVNWVLGWAGKAKVIKPPELRDLVIQQLRQALKMNEERTGWGERFHEKPAQQEWNASTASRA